MPMGRDGRGRPVSTAEAGRAVAEAVASEASVVAAYIFGSLSRGTTTPLSDIDIGLLLADPSIAATVRGRVTDALCRQLRTEHVDVISLTDAPMPVRYRVVRDGLLVVSRDGRALERFVTETVLHYLDFKPLRDRAFRVMRTSILENA